MKIKQSPIPKMILVLLHFSSLLLFIPTVCFLHIYRNCEAKIMPNLYDIDMLDIKQLIL